MPRAVPGFAAALAALVGSATLALAQGGSEPPPTGVPEPERPTRKVLYRDGHTGRHLLGGTWHFRLDPAEQGEQAGFHTNRAIDGWTPTTVPNAWNATDESDASHRGTVGWYRKDFVLPSRDAALDWKLRFEAINHRATVWLNGQLIATHEGPYIPFEAEVPARARRGPNLLVVRVDNRRDRSDVPRGYDRANGRPGGGWWNYGGILREVYLRRFEGVDVEAVRVRSEVSGRRQRHGLLRLRVTLDNPGARDARVRLRTRVADHERISRPIRVAADGSRRVSYSVEVPKPRLWYPGSPELHPVRIDALSGQRVVAGYRLKAGFRELRVSDDGILLVNGRRARLFGVNLHEDHPRRGSAITARDRRRDMRAVGRLGASLIRSHYPLHPRYLELADRMGVTVWDQVPAWQQGHRGFKQPGVLDAALAYLRAMVARDQNHPSVIAWSIGNEFSQRLTSDQEDYIRRAADLLDRIDPTRLRALDIFGYPQNPPADVYHELDALGVNSYFGWYPGPNGQTADVDRLGPFLDQTRAYYPELALFVTEFGAEANRDGPVEEKGTYAFQTRQLRRHLDVYRRKRYLNGAAAWVLRDFRARPDWDGGNPEPQSPWNQKGLLDALWNEKPAFDATAEILRAIEPIARRRYRRGTSR